MIRDIVTAYRRLGWATIRVQPCGKAPIGEWRQRTDEPGDFRPGDNVGVRLGEPSGNLVDVDLDCDEACALAPQYLPPTLTFGRPSKPRSHWLYRCTPCPKTRKPSKTHVELRSTGGQTVFPGSTHESGEVIAWTDTTADLREVTEAELLAAFGRLCIATMVALRFGDAEGDRHDFCLALAGALWHEGWAVEDALDVLLPPMELAAPGDHPHREAAIRETWDDHGRERWGWPTVANLLGPADARTLERFARDVSTTPAPLDAAPATDRPLTDLGNAERFVDDHGEDLRFCEGVGWLRYDGTRWVSDTPDPVDLAAQTVRRMQAAAQAEGAAMVHRWALGSESSGRIRSMIALARDLPGLRVDIDELDADPWVLCCPNGVVDLRTGALSEHERDQWITKCVGVPYDPTATAPRFSQFLLEVFPDRDLVPYVLRYLGYCLTGVIREQLLQVWYGHGANGKSTLIEILRYVLGDYAQTLVGDLLIERRGSRDSAAASPDVARLRGCRFAAGVETKEGQRWNESLVKQLTGGDRVAARHLYREPIEFLPTWKLALAVNHKPVVRGTDKGMWRRIHLVPFEATFEGAKQDTSLLDTLKAEGPGILTLLVWACRQWQRDGLQPPGRVIAEVETYRKSQDVVGGFLEECTAQGSDKQVSKAKLYDCYRRWATQSGEYLHGKHTFNNQIRERGFTDVKRSTWVWVGLDVAVDVMGRLT